MIADSLTGIVPSSIRRAHHSWGRSVYTDRHPKFTRSTLHRLLHNRVYIGEVAYRGMSYKGQFEPLVDLTTFQRVREKFGSDFIVYHKPQLTFASGLITCSHCGRIFTGEHKIKKSPNGTRRDYVYYRCSGYAVAGHSRVRLTEAEVDRQLLAFFQTLRLDEETQQWFVEVIKARARSGAADNKQHRVELLRQKDQVEAKTQALLELRIEGEITQEEFAAKRSQMQDRQAAIRLQLECSDRDDDQVADLAIKAFELSQSLAERWVKADYNAKRTIMSVMLETVRLNCGKSRVYPEKSIQFAAGRKSCPAQWSQRDTSRTFPSRNLRS